MRSRVVAALAGSVVSVLAVTGCTFSAEIANLEPYDPSDGVGADLGDLALRNVLLIANDGGEATLVMTVVNRGEEGVDLNLQFGDEGARQTESLEIPGGRSSTRVGDDPATTVVISDDALTVGALFPIYAEYGSVPGTVLYVPVLDGTLPEYELYVP